MKNQTYPTDLTNRPWNCIKDRNTAYITLSRRMPAGRTIAVRSGLLWVSMRMTVFPSSTTDVGRPITVTFTVYVLS